MADTLGQRIEALAVMLTQQQSITETEGEGLVSDAVYHFFQGLPYFRTHPEDLFEVQVPQDPWQRKSVMALLQGQKRSSSKTVILLGHTDTVGISDYGDLQDLATSPYVLSAKMAEIKATLPPEVQADIAEGTYLFGRGIFDMKSGNAVIMALMEEMAEQIDQWEGNLLYLAVCDEESNSQGMLSCLPELVRLQEEEGLDYLALIDTDYMTTEYPNDPHRYVYMGTVGKLMPSFFLVGRETHVGEAFKGFDPNLLAAELTRRIHLNTDFSDVVEGEVALPPVVLKMRDLKTEYSVQTARTATLFFNYATLSSNPAQVLHQMVQTTEEAFESVVALMNQHYKDYCHKANRNFLPLPWHPRVMTYEELYAAVQRELGPRLATTMEEYSHQLLQDRTVDHRDFALKMVEKLHSLWSDRDPVAIVYFTPPYYPHSYIEGKEGKEKALMEAVTKAIASTDSPHPLVFKKFFPYISDLSYATAPTDPLALQALKGNMPGLGTKYILPLETMQALNLPVMDIGVFGKDAHKFTERVEKEYSFHLTPQLLRKTLQHLLQGTENSDASDRVLPIQ